MLTFRSNSTLFTHVIAAQSLSDAVTIASTIDVEGPRQTRHVETPDIWTRRAVDMAKTPGIIDTIPRFVVDRNDGPIYLDIEYISEALTPDELAKCGEDSLLHCEWICVSHAETHRADSLRAYISRVVKTSNRDDYATMARALAGAWGLGPIPEWHAAILPALIALDIETTDCVNAFGTGVFDMDRAELITEVKRCASYKTYVPNWIHGMMQGITMTLSANVDPIALRERAKGILIMLEWLP